MLCRANNLPVPLVRNDSLDGCEVLPDMDDSRRDDDCGAYGDRVDVGHVEISGQPAAFGESVSRLVYIYVCVCVDPDWRTQCWLARSLTGAAKSWTGLMRSMCRYRGKAPRRQHGDDLRCRRGSPSRLTRRWFPPQMLKSISNPCLRIYRSPIYIYITLVWCLLMLGEGWWSYPGIFSAEDVEVELDAFGGSEGCRGGSRSSGYRIGGHNYFV